MENKIVMKNGNIIIVLLFVFINGSKLIAQHQTQYTQYMFTPSLINPAYVGLDKVMNVSFIHRSQWVGVKGAPVSQTMVLSVPLNEKMGMGLNIIRDEIGPAAETNISIDISYLLQLNSNGLNLSFGMKGGMQVLNVDFSKLTIQNPNDPNLTDINSRITPNIGSGIYVYNRDWYIGLSSPNLLTTRHYSRSKVSTVSSSTHFYLFGGRNFVITDNIWFKPAFLLKSVSGTPIAMDISMNFLFNKKFTAGLSYRYNTAVTGLINFKVNNFLSIGYSYDFDTSNIGHFSGGSHEIMSKYYFNELINDVRQPNWLF